MCIPYNEDSCLLPHKGIILLMLPLALSYEHLAGIKCLILLLYIWLDTQVAVKPLKYVNTPWLWFMITSVNPLKYGLSGIEM